MNNLAFIYDLEAQMCPLLSINDGTVMIEREYKIFYTEVEDLEFELLEC